MGGESQSPYALDSRQMMAVMSPRRHLVVDLPLEQILAQQGLDVLSHL